MTALRTHAQKALCVAGIASGYYFLKELSIMSCLRKAYEIPIVNYGRPMGVLMSYLPVLKAYGSSDIIGI